MILEMPNSPILNNNELTGRCFEIFNTPHSLKKGRLERGVLRKTKFIMWTNYYVRCLWWK